MVRYTCYVKGSDCTAGNEVDEELETSITSNPLAALSATINKALKDNTDAVLANGSQCRETSKEDGYRRVLDKVGNETFPL